MTKKLGTLYLLPVPLGEEANLDNCLVPALSFRINQLTEFIVEHPKTARRDLKRLGLTRPVSEMRLSVLDEHTQQTDLLPLLAPLLEGQDVGLLSEAGCPAVADPGAQLVRLAHQKGIAVHPMVGASSLLLTLMASGACGQRFTFHGYLPVEEPTRTERIRALEKRSLEDDETQLFIETPYRNRALFEALLKTCRPTTWLALGREVNCPQEWIQAATMAEWKKRDLPDLHKRPTVFVMYGR